MKLCAIIFSLVTIIPMTSLAQSGGKQPASSQPNSLNPNAPQREYGPRKVKKSKSNKVTYSLEQQYYDRVLAVAKERKKAEKIMQKPQYSDPMYFGHKRPPKKRSAKKMRYCSECGIRH
jgi:hypothetical protein